MNKDTTIGYLRIGRRTYNIVLQKLENHYENKKGHFIIVKNITKEIATKHLGKLKDFHMQMDYEGRKVGDFYFRVATNDARKLLEKLSKKPEFFMFRGWKKAFDEAVIREL